MGKNKCRSCFNETEAEAAAAENKKKESAEGWRVER